MLQTYDGFLVVTEGLGQAVGDLLGGDDDIVHLSLGSLLHHGGVTGLRPVSPGCVLLLRGVEIHGRGGTACREQIHLIYILVQCRITFSDTDG